jgi:hypothetical protein
MDGHRRWEIFELIGYQAALPEAPHLEDCWVRALRSRRCLASPEQRRAILSATAQACDPLFGAPLRTTYSAAYLHAGTGQRSLATAEVPAAHLSFAACWRDGAAEPDFRVRLPLPEIGERSLPVKDHYLLARARAACPDLSGQIQTLHNVVGRMGERIAVRLGLSRPFARADEQGAGVCWLMADGFFSLADPQP